MRTGRVPRLRLLYTAVVCCGVLFMTSAHAQAQPDRPAAVQVIQGPAAQYVPPPGTCVPMADPTGMRIEELLPQLNPIYYRATSHDEPSSLPAGTILRAPTPTFLYRNLCAVDFAVSDGSFTRVPAVRGLTGEAATQELVAADLRISINEVRSSQRAGLVFEQRPDPDQEVTRQSIVEVTIALPILYDVPDVIGLQLRDAVQRLRGFTVRRADVPSVRPRGEVTDQAPRAPAQQPARAEVRVNISDGSLVPVPAVEGKPISQARAELEQSELQPDLEEREDDFAPGTVATQDPPADMVVRRGSAVRLVVSTGLPVPNVIGQAIEEARQALVRFVVQPTTVTGLQPKGEVVDQDPHAPARLAAGAAVLVNVSDGSQVLVPGVEGRPVEEAQTKLQSVGLAIEAEKRDGDQAPGIVAVQDPKADSQVSRGSAVRLIVSTGLPVPNVVGQNIEQAEGNLNRFKVEQHYIANSAPRGQVIGQDKGPPTRMEANSTVVLQVSDGSLTVSTPVQTNGSGGGGEGPRTPEPPTTPSWVWYLMAFAGVGVLTWAACKWWPRPKPGPQYSASVAPGPVEVQMADARGADPEVRLAATIEHGECRVRFEGEPS